MSLLARILSACTPPAPNIMTAVGAGWLVGITPEGHVRVQLSASSALSAIREWHPHEVHAIGAQAGMIEDRLQQARHRITALGL